MSAKVCIVGEMLASRHGSTVTRLCHYILRYTLRLPVKPKPPTHPGGQHQSWPLSNHLGTLVATLAASLGVGMWLKAVFRNLYLHQAADKHCLLCRFGCSLPTTALSPSPFSCLSFAMIPHAALPSDTAELRRLPVQRRSQFLSPLNLSGRLYRPLPVP